MKTPMIILTLAFLAGCGTYQDSLDNVPLLAADAEAGRAVFELYNCAVCHGADGQSMAPAGSRIIAQIDTQRDIENALYALQASASNRNDTMKAIASGLSSQEIVDVAAFIATLKN